MKNKEVELKFIISKEQSFYIIDDLLNLTNKKVIKNQIDTYYIPAFKDFEINCQTVECLRIRECDNKTVLCYKHIHRECNPVYCDEYEVEINNKKEMEKILFSLEFNIQMIINKKRTSFLYNSFEFDIDVVNDNLFFLEVELKKDNLSVEDIYSFVRKYNLSKENVTFDGIQMLVKNSLLVEKNKI